MKNYQAIPLENLTEDQFKILRSTGLLQDIYPDAPVHYDQIGRNEELFIELKMEGSNVPTIEDRVEALSRNIMSSDNAVGRIEFNVRSGMMIYKMTASFNQGAIDFRSGNRITSIELKKVA